MRHDRSTSGPRRTRGNGLPTADGPHDDSLRVLSFRGDLEDHGEDLLPRCRRVAAPFRPPTRSDEPKERGKRVGRCVSRSPLFGAAKKSIPGEGLVLLASNSRPSPCKRDALPLSHGNKKNSKIFQAGRKVERKKSEHDPLGVGVVVSAGGDEHREGSGTAYVRSLITASACPGPCGERTYVGRIFDHSLSLHGVRLLRGGSRLLLLSPRGRRTP